MKTWIKIILFLGMATGCSQKGGTTTGNPDIPEDSSASGAAAGAVGGALSSSNANGTQTAKLRVETLGAVCPTYKSSSGCSVSGGSMWLDYNSCHFPGSEAVWLGVQDITMSTGSAACGTFPNPGANGSLYRQFVSTSGGTTPSSLSLTSSFGTLGTIDDSSNNLANFDGAPIGKIENGGYGSKVDFDGGGARSNLTVDHRVYSSLFDHSVAGSLTITETAGASSRTVNGSVKVYHNRLQVVGTSTFTNVGHSDICCLPVSGSITTSFSPGNNVSPTAAGSLVVGKSETLTFLSCGLATFTDVLGKTTEVSLSRCY